MTKILLISGSPRKGNTDFVLSKIFDGIKNEKELIFLKDKNIQHCTGCLSCHDKPECVIDDDMTQIRAKILGSDIIVIGTPNYFGNISGLLKDFVDRTHPFYKTEALKDKKVILIMVGGGEIEASQKYLDHTTHGFVKYLKLNLIGSYCFKALNPNDIKQNPESILKIDEITRKINSL
ncbi:flavodoxin family protein [Patescibacteria group bacterium]|nr:flavodoxin family protein [Patescibacteria group bacterium]MBU1246615.1 flavodoxin family protein [Patescibacteria group bacterium]MBU1519330.1 flavodoxin family protein [Patescibacteria group bacterium]MBU1730001.1 flavodoxin family protein [Patescibacteria group bacterium]MBU1956211.1 flavodoxin family protein [Patescibacteria group bacterium]